MPKNWARGLTKGTDPRVARAAAGHRGLRYVRKSPIRPGPIEWSSRLAYAVGLIATDGCLIDDGRHITLGSKDEEQVVSFLSGVGHSRYAVTSANSKPYYRAQISDQMLHLWLGSIGLTPRKSLTLAAVAVPDEFFLAFVRGLLDGDGSVLSYSHNPVRGDYPMYRYDRLYVHFLSASAPHIPASLPKGLYR